jgi:hypothetical protein
MAASKLRSSSAGGTEVRPHGVAKSIVVSASGVVEWGRERRRNTIKIMQV